MKVILKTEAENSLMAIADFIEIVIRMPETADRYTRQTFRFCSTTFKYSKRLFNLQISNLERTTITVCNIR